MEPDRPRHGRNLAWCLGHFSWVVLVCVLLGTAVPLLVAPPTTTYQADALVVAKQLTANPRVLPTLGESAFADGAVTAAVAKDPSLAGEPLSTVQDKLSVVVGPDSITMTVQARDADPAVAARLADIAATAFAAELNRAGSGVGSFAVPAPAVVPTTPLSQTSTLLRAALGALAGLVLGLGVVGLLAALVRPSVTSGDVEEALGVPLLGTVELRRAAPGTYLGPRGVRGIATVTRWLATVPPGRLSLISSPRTEGMRQRVFVMVAIAMSSIRKLRLLAPDHLVDAVHRHLPRGRDGEPLQARTEERGELVLVDGGSPLDIVDPAATTASARTAVVAVAPVGISQRRLRAVALDYLNGGLVGVVLVKRRLGLRAQREPAAAPVPPAAVRTTEDVPEPERA